MSKKHVWQVMEELCHQVDMRHPHTIARTMQETCEQLLEEYESEIAGKFLAIKFEKNDLANVTEALLQKEICTMTTRQCKAKRVKSEL
jgi:hypothetical protein